MLFTDGHLLFTRMNPQESAAAARRPLRIDSKEGGRTVSTLDSEVQQKAKRECMPRDARMSRGDQVPLREARALNILPFAGGSDQCCKTCFRRAPATCWSDTRDDTRTAVL